MGVVPSHRRERGLIARIAEGSINAPPMEPMLPLWQINSHRSWDKHSATNLLRLRTLHAKGGGDAWRYIPSVKEPFHNISSEKTALFVA